MSNSSAKNVMSIRRWFSAALWAADGRARIPRRAERGDGRARLTGRRVEGGGVVVPHVIRRTSQDARLRDVKDVLVVEVRPFALTGIVRQIASLRTNNRAEPAAIGDRRLKTDE